MQVSWLTLWLLLLGTEDYASLEQLESGRAHRRPAEVDMVGAAEQLAAVTADVEVGGAGLWGFWFEVWGQAGPCEWRCFCAVVSCPLGGSHGDCADKAPRTCNKSTVPPQELGGSLTAEALATPEGEALVARCLQLHQRLTVLSQLKPPKDSSLAPLVRRSWQAWLG